VIALERRIEFAHHVDRARILGADDDAVGLHEVFQRRPFLEELGVGDDAVVDAFPARSEFFGKRRLHLVGGTHRHGRFIDDDLVPGHEAAHVARRRHHVLQVGRTILVRWRADGDELQQAVRDGFLDVGGEPQAARVDVRLDHRIQTRLEDRNPAFLENADLVRIEVETEHVVADVGQTGSRNQTDVAGTDDSNFH
jgi:hypothetical protein